MNGRELIRQMVDDFYCMNFTDEEHIALAKIFNDIKMATLQDGEFITCRDAECPLCWRWNDGRDCHYDSNCPIAMDDGEACCKEWRDFYNSAETADDYAPLFERIEAL